LTSNKGGAFGGSDRSQHGAFFTGSGQVHRATMNG